MDRIDISFEHRGKQYSGYFHKVAGVGVNATWHLMDDKQFYLGRLRIGWRDEWVFDASRAENQLDLLANFFGNYVTAASVVSP